MNEYFDVENGIQAREEYEKLLSEYTESIKSTCKKDGEKDFAELRKFPLDIVHECGVFYVKDMIQMLVPKYINMVDAFGVISKTNGKPIFNERYVIPIRNEGGVTENLVGYSPNSRERYIYGTSRYYRREDTLYGLENLSYAYEVGYAILTEGITDAIRLRGIGYRNTFAMCGAHKSAYNMNQLSRCRYGVIKIPDRDNPGQRSVREWNCSRGITLNIPCMFKDVDEMCKAKDGNSEWLNKYLSECIKYLKVNSGIFDLVTTVM